MESRTAVCALALLAYFSGMNMANAHAGHFHAPLVPKTSGYPYAVIKQCTKWTRLAGAAKVPGGQMPSLKGQSLVQHYYYKNCSSSASSSVQLDITLTNGDNVFGINRVPVANYSMAGIVMTQPCRALASKTNKFFNLRNSADATDGGNYLWFYTGAVTDATGAILGHGANDGKPKNPSQLKSIVLFDNNDNLLGAETLLTNFKSWLPKAAFCCNFGPDMVEPNWETKLIGWPGSDC